MKYFFLFSMIILSVFPVMATELQREGVYVDHSKDEAHIVRRIIPTGCRIPVTNDVIWEAGDAHNAIAEKCKITLIKTAGYVSPILVAPGVETYGEIEVLAFLEAMHDADNHYMLIDSRDTDWYEYETIPGAVNLWFRPMKAPEDHPEEFHEIMQKLGAVMQKNGAYNYADAATIVLFCNGPWCSQSPLAIKGLLKLGYPAEKIKWYRGGMHVWKSLSMTTTRDDE